MSIPSATIIGGLSSDHGRNHADFYPTPRECTVALLRAAPKFQRLDLWEPACGDGAISRVAETEFGLNVVSTDLHDRGYGTGGINFLDTVLPEGDVIITNPPFVLASEFIRHAASFGVPFAMLLKSTYWHAKSRHALFRETGPSHVCPMLWRPNFAPERGSAPTMDVCWTIWAPKPAETCIYYPLPRPEEDIFS